jgi:glutamine phosphoribosylpyrophosphate amidotransferase
MERSVIHGAPAPNKTAGAAEDMEVLNELHRRLCVCLEVVEEVLESLEEISGRVTLTILDDDLESLVEECEQYMLCPLVSGSEDHSSFMVRSATVIDEVREFLKFGG